MNLESNLIIGFLLASATLRAILIFYKFLQLKETKLVSAGSEKNEAEL